MSSPGPLDGGDPPAKDESTRQLEAEVDKFLSSNDVDDNAASDLRSCPYEVQRIVLSRGGLGTARNPSAALIARIRDARTSVTSVGTGNTGSGGDPSVESFLKANEVDESAAASLRSAPPDVQRTVIARGELTGARNPSSALLSRIRDAKQNGGRDGGGGGSSGYGGGGGIPPPPGYPPAGYGMPGMAAGMSPGGYPGYPGYGGYGMYPGYCMGGAYGMGAAAYGSSAYMQQYAAAAAAAAQQPMGAYGAYGAAAAAAGAQPQLQDRDRSRSRSRSSSYSSRSRRRHKKSHRKRR